MLGELSLNANQNPVSLINEERIKNLNQEFYNSLEEYLIEAINTVQSQVSLLMREPIADSIRISQSLRNLEPERLNLLVSTVVKINRQKLDLKFKAKLDNIKSIANNLSNQENVCIKLDELVDFESYFKKAEVLLKKFDNFFPIISRTMKQKMSKRRKQKYKKSIESDFFSDTELIQLSVKTSKNKIDKILRNFKNLDFDNDSDCSTLSEDEHNQLLTKKFSYSDTLLYQDNLEMEVVSSEDDRTSIHSDISLDNQSNEYYGDRSSNSNSNSNSFSSNETTEDMEQDVENLYQILEKHSDSEEEMPQIGNRDQDPDCIIICENDCPTKPKSSKKLNKCLEIIDKLISNNKDRPRPPISLGMKCLALKDRHRFKWKLAKITRITDMNLLKHDSNMQNSFSQVHKMICNTKYSVVFDSDDEDENECEADNADDNMFKDLQDEDYTIDSSDSNDEDSSEDEIFDLTNKQSNKKRKLQSNTQQPNSSNLKKGTNRKNMGLVELTANSIAFLDNYEFIPNIRLNRLNNRALFEPKSRVVTLYQLKVTTIDNSKILYSDEYMSSGTVLEVPSISNFRRYLVLFDNGVASYVKPDHLFPIFDMFSKPLEILNYDHIMFLQNYCRLYPERTMVRLSHNDYVHVFFNNKWNLSRVVDIEGSLVSLEIRGSFINKQKSTQQLVYSIKLHRGSYCLYPMYEQFITKLENSIKDSNTLSPFEEYVKDKRENNVQSSSLHKYLSYFASSVFPSTGLKNKINKTKCLENNMPKPSSEKVIQGQLKHLNMDQLMRDEIIPFNPHPCTNACVAKWEYKFNEVKGVNPLLMPVLHGWQRHIGHISKNTTTMTKKFVRYVAPCGRMLRSTAEVDHYLYLTNSKLTIDMFTTDCYIHTDREFEANAKNLKINDITENQENVPISVVNCVDNNRPDDFVYAAKRIPLEDVPLNTDTSLMEGCNCTDNCRDRTKCACWRKTFEATLFNSNQMNTNVGYRGRRLMDMVHTGIFECNSNCKCDCRCSNRVVQNGISVRLQLFKTNNKGWGLRCLDDVPKGTFICNYAGHLITEEMSDIRGRELGDEYFAELDFVDYLKQCRNGFGEMNSFDRMDSDSLESVSSRGYQKKQNSKYNNYQRPKQFQKKQFLGLNETDFILLDSDEDEQDRNNPDMIIPTSKKEDEYNKNRALSRQQKDKRMATSIDSNRFFTNQNNMFFFENYMLNSSVFIMDAKTHGNIGRYFNHSCSPNIFVQNVFVDTYDLRFPWIAFFAHNSIKAGTELCWDYNYTIGSVKDRVLYCHCNSANCRGRLL